MSALTDFLPFALHHLWQAALIALALAAGYAALGRQPGQRLVLGLTAFALAAIAPLATLLPEFGFGNAAPMEGAAAIADAAFDFGGDTELIDTAAPLARPAFAWDVIAAQAAALIMLAGSVLLALRTLVAAFAAERLRRAATPVTLPEPVSIRFAGIAVRQHAEVGGPMVVGLTRPTILLPEHFTDARTASALAAILEHERAHVSRADPAIAFAQKLVLALFWWNPAMHWISTRIDRDREMACDAEAVRRCGNARELAITLADEAEARLTGRVPALAVGAMHDPSELRRRVDALLTPARGAGRAALAAPLLLALTVGVAAWATPKTNASGTDATVEMVGFANWSATEAALGAALVEAAMRHDLVSVQELVGSGAPVDFASPGDGTALIEAARTGDTSLALYLINQGADVDLGVAGDGNPLIMAAAHKKFDMVRLLVEAGADVNAYVPGDETPLINAARTGKLELVQYLVEQGADVNLAMWTNLDHDPEFRSPLWAARQSGNWEIVNYLESRGAVHEPSARP